MLPFTGRVVIPPIAPHPPLLEQVGDTKLEFHRSGEFKWMQHQEN